MNTELLLQEVSSVTKKFDLLYQKTGGYFNVFEILNTDTKEVAICKILHDLLNPKGSHYQGDIYLRLFMKYVIPEIHLSDQEYEQVKVYREYRIHNDRRIDLFIQTSQHAIPIEVKIFASDQKNQCADYFQEAVQSNVYYLTRFGNMPSEASTQDMSTVTAISFETHIITWLTKCLEHKETIKIAPIREVLLQLMTVIRKFTNRMEDEQTMEVSKILASSSEHMKNAVMIEQSIKISKIDMMTKVFQTLEDRICASKREELDDYLLNDRKLIKEYYNKDKSTLPSINYLYKENVKPDIDLLFCIVIDWQLYAGYYIIRTEGTEETLTDEEIKKLLPHIPEPKREDDWIHWEYLPINDENNTPNFRSPDFDDEYYKLFDKEYFNKFIDDCMDRINELFPCKETINPRLECQVPKQF